MEFHHVLVVSNIKNHIPIILEMEKDQHGAWVELFRIHAHSHQVLHNIVPSMGKKPSADNSNVEYEQLTTLVFIVLQWIYSTISIDLLTTIMEADSTNIETWNHLTDIFQDNQNACDVTLEQEFSNIRIEAFPMCMLIVNILRCSLAS
ncbi:uncharacterized protein LOC127123604 [Lathyrus oleraceus]|uniref:uncharacterized protein LOC127123604 n=1 Tax=Pisum sativum TaxID=3888 RepID=UPI0021D20AEE|nr:uncharacterized protein LOC127123604 [Pisum sativum]